MTIHTTSRGAARLRLAAVVVAPLLAFSVACGDDGEGVRADGGEIASVPLEPSPDAARGKGEGQGSAKPSAQGKSAFYDAQMEYVRCMRTKGGSKDYPDPKLSGYLDWDAINEMPDRVGGGQGHKGGKDGICGPELRAAGNLEPQRDKQQDYESLMAHATCMRDEGVSRFASPTLSGGGVMPGGEPNPVSPVLDEKSPVYKKAREACKGKLLEGLDGMQ
ncbi:hypothetical protein [Streptomyces sp. NPDC047315]|uniref:hypothetical protein n=1 Tax=Streptomyces sp. NPDC047315 TaxID=3155142 RepID=UPI003402207F